MVDSGDYDHGGLLRLLFLLDRKHGVQEDFPGGIIQGRSEPKEMKTLSTKNSKLIGDLLGNLCVDYHIIRLKLVPKSWIIPKSDVVRWSLDGRKMLPWKYQ